MAIQSNRRATPSTKAWNEVSKSFNSLGKDLRRHFDGAADDLDAERAAIEKSIQLLASTLEDGFGALGKIVRDPALRKNVAEAAASVREALLATFDSASDQVLNRAPTSAAARVRSAAGRAKSVATKATKAAPTKATKAAPTKATRPTKAAPTQATKAAPAKATARRSASKATAKGARA